MPNQQFCLETST